MIAALLSRALFVAAVALAPIASAAADTERLPVPSVTIYPGDTISQTMLTLGDFAPGTAENLAVIGSSADLVGKIARRTLLPGKLITRTSVSEPMLVQKGAIISAEYQAGGLLITASVLALQSGALNDAVQVRNIDSGKTIVGSVQADGTIRIGGK